MKNLLIGIALLILIGIAGFLYRNSLESHDQALQGPAAAHKLCLDGSLAKADTIGGEPKCPASNVQDTDNGISYVLPEGYVADEHAYGADSTLIGAFMKDATTTSSQTIIIRAYPIPSGETAQQVMLEETRLEPSDMNPKDMSAFTPKIIGTNTFSSIVVERFEGVVDSAYFLARADDVLRFDIVEKDVQDWTSPTLDINSLPEHQAFLKMLNTLQVK